MDQETFEFRVRRLNARMLEEKANVGPFDPVMRGAADFDEVVLDVLEQVLDGHLRSTDTKIRALGDVIDATAADTAKALFLVEDGADKKEVLALLGAVAARLKEATK